MATKNLGLVKAIFAQSTSPTRTDVLWYDTINNVRKVYDTVALDWLPVELAQLSGPVTDGSPTSAEINSIVGLTAVEAGIGYKATIRDTGGTQLLYMVESDGASWFWAEMIKAL